MPEVLNPGNFEQNKETNRPVSQNMERVDLNVIKNRERAKRAIELMGQAREIDAMDPEERNTHQAELDKIREEIANL